MARRSLPGRLFVLEGPDGVGKSTFVRALGEHLRSHGHDLLELSFPGKVPGSLGELVYRVHHDEGPLRVGEHVTAREAGPPRRGSHRRDRATDRACAQARPNRSAGPLSGGPPGCTASLAAATGDSFARSSMPSGRPGAQCSQRLPSCFAGPSQSIAPTTCRIGVNSPPSTAVSLAANPDRIPCPSSTTSATRPTRSRRSSTAVEPYSGRRLGRSSSRLRHRMIRHAVAPANGASHILPLKPTVVYDTYWRFAAERQEIFFRRVVRTSQPPWTADPILAEYKFTNAYRASDRVSQYLIRTSSTGRPARRPRTRCSSASCSSSCSTRSRLG